MRTRHSPITDEMKRGFVSMAVTLDGLPAKVTGYRLDFPIVSNACKGVEFSWETVLHVVTERGGAFRS